MNLKKARVRLLRLLFVLLGGMALFVGSSSDTSDAGDMLFQGVGYILLMTGLCLRLWSILYVGSRKSQELITTGPYSLCRNPLYVGTILLTVGTALSFENLAMCLFALAAIIPAHIAVVLSEERRLRSLFGPTYEEYARQTPRFLFRLSSYKSDPAVRVPLRSLKRAAIDASGILMIPPLATLVDMLQDKGILHVLWRWP